MPLDGLPIVVSFFGADLKTGSCIIAALGIVHPLAFGCTLCQSISHLLATTWALAVLYSAASIVLMVGIFQDNLLMITIWIWYALVFVVIMIILMTLLVFAAATQDQRCRVVCAIFGIVWYLLSLYFVFVVNSYRIAMSYKF